MRAREQRTVTQEKAYWLLPKACKKVEYKPVSQIDFTSSASRKRKFDAQLCGPATQSFETAVKKQSCESVKPATEAQQTEFLEDLRNHGYRPAIMSLTKPFHKAFIPKAVSMASQLPEPLSELRKDDNLMKGWNELKKDADSISIVIREDQVRAVEALTRTQSKSKLWYTHRAGRITSSCMKSACTANLETPPISLINKVCYPDSQKLHTPATQWGRENEVRAKQAYININKTVHKNLKVAECGLFLCKDYPHIGASPDGTVTCDCCGTGCLEIKCPFTFVNGRCSNHPCYIQDENNELHLNTRHAYYYQVQTHLLVTKLSYCDFIIWTPSELNVHRVTADRPLQQIMVQKATNIFKGVILLELMGCFYSRTKAQRSKK